MLGLIFNLGPPPYHVYMVKNDTHSPIVVVFTWKIIARHEGNMSHVESLASQASGITKGASQAFPIGVFIIYLDNLNVVSK